MYGFGTYPFVNQPVAISEFPRDLWYRTVCSCTQLFSLMSNLRFYSCAVERYTNILSPLIGPSDWVTSKFESCIIPVATLQQQKYRSCWPKTFETSSAMRSCRILSSSNRKSLRCEHSLKFTTFEGPFPEPTLGGNAIESDNVSAKRPQHIPKQ